MTSKASNKSKLLFDSNPIIIIPELAVLIGLNESIILQQIHYWLQKSEHIHDGRVWVYNSIPQWCEQFPFLSQRSIERATANLKNLSLVLTGNYNKLKQDRTLWYTINYEALEALQEKSSNPPKTSSRQNGGMGTPQGEEPANPHEISSRQNGGMPLTNWRDDHDNLTRPLPEITTEITPEKEKTHTAPQAPEEKPKEQKPVCEDAQNELKVLQKEIRETIGEEIGLPKLEKLVHSASIERIRYHLQHWHIHKKNQTKKGAGYFITIVENNIEPIEPERKPYQTEKLSQRNNFEQRHYTDEELERFYVNLS